MAHEFADLHDRAGRMKAKGVIRDVVTWRRSRSYFFWRAKRRIVEDGLAKRIHQADSAISISAARAKLAKLAGNEVYGSDQGFLEWVDKR